MPRAVSPAVWQVLIEGGSTRWLPAPDELLVAVKVAFGPEMELATAADAIRNAEARVREALPAVCAVYLQPDVKRGE